MSQKMGIKLAGGGSGLSADCYSYRADLLKLNLEKGVLRMLNRLGLVIHWFGFIGAGFRKDGHCRAGARNARACQGMRLSSQAACACSGAGA